MAFSAGTISLVSTGSNSLQVAISAGVQTPPTVLPVTAQWYRSTNPLFVAGPTNLVAGATSLSLNDSSLIPNTAYYYKVILTDSTPVTPLTATSATSAAFTTYAPSQSQNAFSQSPTLGMLDLKVGTTNVMAVEIDPSQATPLFPGSAVQLVDSPYGGLPKVIGCSTAAGSAVSGVYGFLCYDIKSQSFPAGARAEIAMDGSFMWLYASSALPSGQQVVIDPSSPGTVTTRVGVAAGLSVVGAGLDQAAAPGSLIRVKITAPSYTVTV